MATPMGEKKFLARMSYFTSGVCHDDWAQVVLRGGVALWWDSHENKWVQAVSAEVA